MSNDENVVYVGKNKVLLGIRGTASKVDIFNGSDLDDLRADLGILGKRFRHFFGIEKYAKDDKSPAAFWEKKYEERILRSNEFYDKLKKKYPNKEIIMGGHSLAGTIIKDIAFKNKKDSLKGYTFNSYFHPDNLEDDSRLSHRGVAGDLVSLSHQLYEGNGFRDYKAEGKAGENLENLIATDLGTRKGLATIDKYIENRKTIRQLKMLGEGAPPSEIAAVHISENVNVNERLEKVLSKIEFKESQGKKISNKLYNEAMESLKEVEEWNNYLIEHPDYGYGGSYDYEENTIEEILDDPAFEDTLMEDLKVVTDNEVAITRLGYLSTILEKMGVIGDLYFVSEFVKAIHSSDNFQPRKELRESKKKENKLKKRREKRDEVLMGKILETEITDYY